MTNSTIIFQSLIRVMESIIDDVVNKKNKVQYHFFLDMVFGIIKSSSLILNDIAHALNEKTNLKKVNYRLQRNLSGEISNSLKHNLISKGLGYMNEEQLIFVVDDSDIVKPYGKKFENLAVVKDGSSNSKEYGIGYRVTSIVGISKTYKHPLCLFTHIHNSVEKNYKSTNHITNLGLQSIFTHLKPRSGFFVFDRGYDDQKLMNFIHDNNQFFLIRIRQNRLIILKNKKSSLFNEAKRRKGKVNIEVRYKGENTILKASHFQGRINGYKDKVSIVVIYMFNNSEPMILITNEKITSKDGLIHIVLRYISRWKIEEQFRFKKVQFGMENFRVKALNQINNLMFVLDVVILFMSHLVETQKRNVLYQTLITLGKGIKERVSISYYQLSSGLKTLFTSNKMGVKNYKQIERWESEEMNLFNSIELSDKKRVRKTRKKLG